MVLFSVFSIPLLLVLLSLMFPGFALRKAALWKSFFIGMICAFPFLYIDYFIVRYIPFSLSGMELALRWVIRIGAIVIGGSGFWFLLTGRKQTNFRDSALDFLFFFSGFFVLWMLRDLIFMNRNTGSEILILWPLIRIFFLEGGILTLLLFDSSVKKIWIVLPILLTAAMGTVVSFLLGSFFLLLFYISAGFFFLSLSVAIVSIYRKNYGGFCL